MLIPKQDATERIKRQLTNRISPSFVASFLFVFLTPVLLSRPLLEEWGIIAWFNGADTGHTWWSAVLHGTPMRPFQLIGFILGYRLGALTLFGFNLGPIIGMALGVALISALKFFLVYWILENQVQNRTRLVISLMVTLPGTWTSSLYLQSMSGHVSICFFLICFVCLVQTGKRFLYISLGAISTLLLLMTYQALYLDLIAIPFLLTFANAEFLNFRSYLKILFKRSLPFLTGTCLYIGYLLFQIPKAGSFGYEGTSFDSSKIADLPHLLQTDVIRIYSNFWSYPGAIFLIIFLSLFLALNPGIRFLQNLLREKSGISRKFCLVLALAPLTSLTYFSYPDWLNDPNRFLLPPTYFVFTFMICSLHAKQYGSTNTLKKQPSHQKSRYSILVPGILSLAITMFYGMNGFQNFQYEKEVLNGIGAISAKSHANKIVIIDETGKLGDYYRFLGDSVIEVALQTRGLSISIKTCSTITGMLEPHENSLARGNEGTRPPLCAEVIPALPTGWQIVRLHQAEHGITITTAGDTR